jgi:hypothetical protein
MRPSKTRSRAEFGAQDTTYTTRSRLTSAGAHKWTLGTPIQMVGSDAVSSPELLAVAGTANHVWLMYEDPKDGLCFDRVQADGTWQHAVVPSPEPAPHRNGWGLLSIGDDEKRIYAVFNTLSRNPGDDDRTAKAYWDGQSWTTFADSLVGDSWGMGGSVGWGQGVAAVRVGNDFSLALSTIRTR